MVSGEAYPEVRVEMRVDGGLIIIDRQGYAIGTQQEFWAFFVGIVEGIRQARGIAVVPIAGGSVRAVPHGAISVTMGGARGEFLSWIDAITFIQESPGVIENDPNPDDEFHEPYNPDNYIEGINRTGPPQMSGVE